MRLLFLLPCNPKDPRGNSTTAIRISEELVRRGYDSELADVNNMDLAAIGSRRADLVIALHAAHCGPAAEKISQAWQVPYVILFTGTDLNGQPSKGATDAVAKATALVALGIPSAKRARDIYDGCGPRLSVIPQAVAPLPYRPGSRIPDNAPALDKEDVLVLVPAGVREIKDPLRAITALVPLESQRSGIQLWFLGPDLESSTGDALRQACTELPWVHWLAARPREELLPFFRRANVVLSTSRSEGGAPNSLLEAVLVGRPVLASSIPAHREFPGAESCFRDDAELRKRLRLILDEPERAMMKSRKMEEVVRQVHSPAAESLAWDRLLRPLVTAVIE